MRRRLIYFLLLLTPLASLAGCMVGPNYSRPKIKVEKHFGELEKTTGSDPADLPSRAVAEPAALARWWRVFGDPELDRLIGEAAGCNYSVRIAAARIRQARAQRGVVSAELFPQVNADAGYNLARGSKNVTLPLGAAAGGRPGVGGAASNAEGKATAQQANSSSSSGSSVAAVDQISPLGKGGLPGVTTELFQVGFDANWEIDLFGGTRRRIEAATADLQAAVENHRDVMVTLLAEVAQNYVQVRGAQHRLRVAKENAAAQREILKLTESLRSSGLGTDLDVARQAGQLATTTSLIPPLEAQRRQAIHGISTLLGREPNELSDELERVEPIPVPPPDVPVGLPSELLQRRPDIRRAERQLASATALVGGAIADLFPKFALTGTAGLDSSTSSRLLEWKSRYYGVTPTVVWPVFDAGRIASNIRLQEGNRQEADLTYRNTILTALREVEDALVNYATEQSRRGALEEALKQSRLSLDLARNRYTNGLGDFLTVLDAQRALLSNEDALAQSDQVVAIDLVALYKALGGGWETGTECAEDGGDIAKPFASKP